MIRKLLGYLCVSLIKKVNNFDVEPQNAETWSLAYSALKDT